MSTKRARLRDRLPNPAEVQGIAGGALLTGGVAELGGAAWGAVVAGCLLLVGAAFSGAARDAQDGE